MKRDKRWQIGMLAIVCAIIGVMATTYRAKSSEIKQTPGMQEIMNLDRRMTYLEQRLTTIEFNVNRLQQQIALAQRANPSTDSREVERRLLLQEVETLRNHVREIECGLAKLDERTLPPSSRATAKESARPTDPCRLNVNTPLQLPPRP